MFHLVLVALVFVFAIFYSKRRRDKASANPKRLPYPPGPPPLPLIGNLLDVPSEYDWLTYCEWAKVYGDIIHLRVLDKHIIVINSFEAANELFEKRSAIYSDRPDMPMLVDLMGWTFDFGFLKYGPEWKQHRKTFHRFFSPAASKEYIPLQTKSARYALRKLLEDPNDWMQIARFTMTSTIIRAAYGLEIEYANDPYVINAEKVMASSILPGVPGKFLVDTLPFLKHIPSWFPGAGFKRQAKVWRGLISEFVNEPFDRVRANMEKGSFTPCVASQLIEELKEQDGSGIDEDVARNITAIAYGAGADTTVTTMQLFFLAMALHPEVQRKAQKQLDNVIGTDRLPNLDDITALPYVETIVKELFRWHPVTPLALAHMTTENDEYNGYHIPKGAIVHGNAWAILHDEKAYPEPMSFNPERFLKADGSLNPEVRDPGVAAFGFGRRICPGRYMAMNGTLIAVASLLATFNIERACKEEGVPVSKEVKMSSGLQSYPYPFECKITPRSSAAIKLVVESVSDE